MKIEFGNIYKKYKLIFGDKNYFEFIN